MSTTKKRGTILPQGDHLAVVRFGDRPMIVTANADGSIPLNSKVVVELHPEQTPPPDELMRLFAAAPALLEALIGLVREFDAQVGGTGDELNAARAALALAEGGD